MNNNELNIFNSEEFGQVRAVDINGKPYAVASDIAKALGYKNISRDIQRHCSDVEKVIVNQNGASCNRARKTQEMLVIQEENIIRLIQKSKTKALEYKTEFSNWLISHNLISDSIILETRKEIEFLSTLEKILKPMNYSLQRNY